LELRHVAAIKGSTIKKMFFEFYSLILTWALKDDKVMNVLIGLACEVEAAMRLMAMDQD